MAKMVEKPGKRCEFMHSRNAIRILRPNTKVATTCTPTPGSAGWRGFQGGVAGGGNGSWPLPPFASSPFASSPYASSLPSSPRTWSLPRRRPAFPAFLAAIWSIIMHMNVTSAAADAAELDAAWAPAGAEAPGEPSARDAPGIVPPSSHDELFLLESPTPGPGAPLVDAHMSPPIIAANLAIMAAIPAASPPNELARVGIPTDADAAEADGLSTALAKPLVI